MGKYILCIDRGTTNIKVSAFDLSCRELCTVSQSCAAIENPRPGWYEQDMDLIWERTVLAVRSLMKKGFNPAGMEAISIAGQGSGLYLLDSEGRPVRKGILSLDKRSIELCNELKASLNLSASMNRTGGPLAPYSIMALLCWLKLHEPESYSCISGLCFSKDWIRYKLTGRLNTDITESNAAGINLTTHEYDLDYYHVLGLDEMISCLPPIIRPWDVAGFVNREAAAALGICEGVPVMAGAHDIAACSLGTGGNTAGHLTLTMGTLSILLAVTDSPDRKSKDLLSNCGIPPKTWLSIYSLGGMGANLSWYYELLFSAEKAAAAKSGENVFEQVERVLCSRKMLPILCHPFAFGGPDSNNKALGGLYNLSSKFDRYDVLMAVYQGMACACRDAIDRMRSRDGFNEIWLDGGGAQSRIFGQLLADMSDCPVYISSVKESVCRGAAMCALMGLDQGDLLINDSAAAPQKTFWPDRDKKDIVNELLVRYKEITNVMEKPWRRWNESTTCL